VPGIDVTNDPLLQTRLFSYVDTQLNRFNSANFTEVPINRPVAPVHNHQQAGFMRHTINKGKVNYWPNSRAGGDPAMAPENEGGYVHYTEKVEGHKIRARSESFNDHYTQATLFWNSLTMPEKEHLVGAAHFELGKVMSKEIRQRQVGNFYKVDPKFAQMVAEGIGVEVPKDQEVESPGNYLKDDHYKKMRNGKSVKASPALSMEIKKVETAKTRKVAILVEDGFAYDEVMRLKEALAAVGAQSEIVSMKLGKCKANSGEELEVDKSHLTADSVMYDAVYIPEGEKSIQSMLQKGESLHFVNEAFKHCKPIATSGNGVQMFEKAFVLGVDFADRDSKKVVSSKGVVTAGIEANADEFFESFINAIKKHRHWDRQEKVMVPA